MTRARRTRSAGTQRGMALLVGMVVLVMVLLLVLGSFQLGRSNLTVVGNAQQRGEALSAAQQTIETAFTSPLLTSSPGAVFTNACPGFPSNTLCYDANGDGTNDFAVQLTPDPKCVKAQPIPVAQLNFADPTDQVCSIGTNQSSFGMLAASGNSNCANTMWDVRALAQGLDASGTVPASGGAKAVVDQGVAVRVESSVVATSCP